ncbi:hypothetical protein BDA99DRAFT_525929 [Phascolomyces articulosus]|uniref:F-box domain-containing protein n=1 Tax=Phascolomyces articulosus TaxID=60185 RepID=A0AAD5JY48_9FUNG|nr:hypothetical protein BDA99DRAFT_525929 [Phascolomyces articulosus]
MTGASSAIRIDFVKYLPIEIVSVILDYFEVLELFKLLGVSRAWKNRLLAFNKLWSNVIIHDDDLNLIVVDALADIAHKVERLKLRSVWGDDTKNPCGRKIFNLIKNGAFLTLERLDLMDYTIPREYDIYHLLDGVANTLISLKLKPPESEQFHPIYLENIVSICKRLEQFWCPPNIAVSPPPRSFSTQAIIHGNTTIIPTTVTSTSLKQLIVDPDGHTPDHFVKRIVSLCPNIRRLSIQRCSHQMLDVIQQHYGNQLQYLLFNASHGTSWASSCYSKWVPQVEICVIAQQQEQYQKPEGRDNNKLIRREEKGLRYLSVYQFPKSSCVSLIHQHEKTLEELHLSFVWMDGQMTDEATTAAFETIGKLTNLRVLGLDCCFHLPQTVVTILTRVSVETLHSLYLISIDLSTDRRVLPLIKQLTHLKHLFVGSMTKVDYNDLIQLIEHFSNPSPTSNSSCLQTISISGNDLILDDRLLLAIARIRTLKKISIIDPRQITEKGVDQFCRTLQRLNSGSLRSLVFERVHTVSNTSLQYLALIPNLKKIILRYVKSNKLTREGVTKLLGDRVIIHDEAYRSTCQRYL